MIISSNDRVSRSRRFRGRRGKFICEINVTPFVDITLVLLIVFMVSAPLLVNGVSIDLPRTEASSLPLDTKTIKISLDDNNKIYLDDAFFADKEQLLLALKQKVKDPQQQQIFVHGAKTVPYDAILQLLALLQQAGFKRLALASLRQH